jgi:hypothetical protein
MVRRNKHFGIMTSPPTAWHLFAWQGVRLHVPADWNLASVDGCRRRGYCRLDDDEGVRLQLRWGPASRHAPASALVDNYLRKTRKRGAVRIRRDTKLVRLREADSECFEVRDEPLEFGMAVRVGRRCALVRVPARGGRGEKAVARRVLASYREGPEEGRVPWSVYGFRFRVPNPYALDDYAFKAGRLDFTFKAGRKRLKAARIALAALVLKDCSLLEWARRDLHKALRGWKATWETDGGSVLRVTGKWRGLKGRLRQNAALRCRIEHCEEANAIYVAQMLGAGRNDVELDAFAASFGASAL